MSLSNDTSPGKIGKHTDHSTVDDENLDRLQDKTSLHGKSQPNLQHGREPLSSAGLNNQRESLQSQSMPEAIDITKQRHQDGAPPAPPVFHPAGRRKSTQSPDQRGTYSSQEFDRRYDGPFARPSHTMTGHSALSAPIPLDITPPPPGSEAGTGHQVLLPEPPPLNYTLRTRKISIMCWWTVIVFDSTVLPIGLYFGLWYGVGPGTNTPTQKNEKLSANTVFSIVTAAIGGASILEYFLRFWSLWKKSSTCRVIGAHRWYLDWFHWNFSLAWIIVMIELIVGSVPDDPYIRLLAMPLATMLYVFGTELLIVDILRYYQVPAPCRISSVPKGAQLRPCIYSLIEDIVATDGGGGTAFREALDLRYETSHVFRAMLRRLGVFWAIGAEAMAVTCTIVIFTVEADIAYTVGWSVPFVWAGVWTLCTFWYVKKELKREKSLWAKDAGKQPA